ncbi:MAG: LemA family protein [Bacteroidales bacterium]|nr:LemA family protein [Bacteroidales bacterium]
MKKGLIILGIIVAVVIFVIIWCVNVRNGIISYDQNVDEAWGNVENQYQRRLDLIPNLVNAVKGYAQHESSTFEKVTEARAGLKQAYDAAKTATTDQTPEDLQKFQQTQANLNRQLGIYINAVHEAYPDLKANQNFMDLQVQLEGTENRIATERTRYNAAVKEYNTKILQFPGSMFSWGYSKKQMFSADPEASRAPKVDFGTDSSSTSTTTTSSDDDF